MPATKTRSKRMTMPELRIKAGALGIDAGTMKKVELIHTIQAAEGYQQCFGWSNGQCSNTNCCFIADCLKTKL